MLGQGDMTSINWAIPFDPLGKNGAQVQALKEWMKKQARSQFVKSRKPDGMTDGRFKELLDTFDKAVDSGDFLKFF
jgi:hypothetical protein